MLQISVDSFPTIDVFIYKTFEFLIVMCLLADKKKVQQRDLSSGNFYALLRSIKSI